MKSILRHLLITGTCCILLDPCSRAIEPGFIPLLDRDHTDGWKHWGAGGVTLKDGVGTASVAGLREQGVFWYSKQTFSDFVLKLEFRLEDSLSNSGVYLRIPDPGNDVGIVRNGGYEVQIYGGGGKITADQRTGSIYRLAAPTSVPLREKSWNDYEITAVGQKYRVMLNGKLVNEFIGSRATMGYIGLQTYSGPPVHFRNVRIKELSQPSSSLVATQGGGAVDPNQPLLETLSQQAPNASAWVLAPLDRGVPPDVRQNVTYLREDLLDEASKRPKASPEAYKIGEQLCNTMIAALDERDRALAHAGFRAVEAQARTGVTSQALEARRNYKMSWPQYAREESQRAELKSQANANAAVMAAKPKLEWSQRTDQIRPTLDALYKQFRATLRQGEAAK